MQRYKRAMELVDEGDFRAALTEFKKAYELAPTYKLLYKIGQVCYRLQDYACALRSFEDYLAEGEGQMAPRLQKQVEEEIELLRHQVGRIEVTANVFGARIYIDDALVGTTPLEEPVLVSIGRRKVMATKQGRTPVTETVEVAGGELKKVDIELPALQGETRTIIQDSPSKMTAWSWVGIAAAGAMAVGATVTGVLALSASDDLEEMTFAGSEPTAAVEDQQSEVKALALATDILAPAAAVTLGMTLILTFTRSTPQPAEQEPAEQGKPWLRLEPQIGLGSVGLVGEF